jgi:DNA-binding NtrC family response regulator
MYKLMLVDDEGNILRSLQRALALEPYEVETFTTGSEALARLTQAGFDLILSDYRMPGMDGITFLTECKKRYPDTMRLILSGYTDLEALMAAINQAQIYRFICKPWQDYDLKTAIFQALSHRAVLSENRRLAEQVRRQQSQLFRQKHLLKQLESENPGITHVKWAEDGSVILDDEGGV